MALLKDYAITPDVFDMDSYPNDDICGMQLQKIREVLMSEGLVRDLRSGNWSQLLTTDERRWHNKAKMLVARLRKTGRLVPYSPELENSPADDLEWCEEALRTHDRNPLSGGIIVTDHVKRHYPSEKLVEKIDQLSSASWWPHPNAPSIRPARTIRSYQRYLDPVLRYANSLMFIDPYLDPSKPHYVHFSKLLTYAAKKRGSRPAPLIEIHRASSEGSGTERKRLNIDSLQKRFFQGLEEPLQHSGLKVEVFIWDRFHDRHLISDLVGILLANGFDTTNNPRDKTTWSRMGTGDRDEVQRQFDPAGPTKPLERFTIP